MRWRFFDPNNAIEVQEREAILAKIDDWWRAFRAEHETIRRHFSNAADFDLPEWMAANLQSIHSALMWEYAPAVHCRGHRLVITPEADRQLRPLVHAILERAPALDGWEFYEYRLAEDLPSTLETIQCRIRRDASDFKVCVSRGEHHRIDLKYTAPSIPDAEEGEALHAAFVATETLLGEECLDNWIGVIEVAPMPRASGFGRLLRRPASDAHFYIGLERLRDTVHSLIGSIVEQLPPTPHIDWVEDASWSLWQLKPQEADEYFGQSDLYVARSANKEMWVAAHRDIVFHSARFSRCGETFCYVKIDGSEWPEKSHFADKAEIEDALDEALKPGKLGCTIGGGTGLRYSYIDLALTDVDKAVAAIRERLRAGHVPKRSWIQFFDSDLAAEWIGIYDDTLPPPMSFEA